LPASACGIFRLIELNHFVKTAMTGGEMRKIILALACLFTIPFMTGVSSVAVIGQGTLSLNLGDIIYDVSPYSNSIAIIGNY